jgi:hypothetical protein
MKDSTVFFLFALCLVAFAYLFLKLAEDNEVEGGVTLSPLGFNLKSTPRRFPGAALPRIIEGN